ncbi:hypothetical protein MCHI_002813 [Candidatus Magnetoovum chiemensis]|nr:hypothetical protein MCHI_002813 [Candidatus Magnetoovum chiemensis]
MEHKFRCICGQEEVSINFKNELLPPETLIAIYCPKCSGEVKFNPETMIKDNNWILEYEMDIARLMGSNLPASHLAVLSPELIFDEDYCSWRGIYPGDHIDSLKEKESIVSLAKVDPKRYIQELKTWANSRMEKLKSQGWRKAHERVTV